jgi:tetratricopeptide (TPR) repeat protein
MRIVALPTKSRLVGYPPPAVGRLRQEARVATSWRLTVALILLSIPLLSGTIHAATGQPVQKSPSSGGTARPGQVDAILDDVVDRLWSRGDWYWHEGRYEERVAVDRLIIRMQPRFAEAYGTAGWLLESLGRPEEALAMYRQAVAAVPDRWETHHDLGMFHYQRKEYVPAAESFRRATQQRGTPGYVWKMQAHALERSGDLAGAVAAWEAAGRVAPEDGAIPVNLRRVRAKLDGEPKE